MPILSPLPLACTKAHGLWKDRALARRVTNLSNQCSVFPKSLVLVQKVLAPRAESWGHHSQVLSTNCEPRALRSNFRRSTRRRSAETAWRSGAQRTGWRCNWSNYSIITCDQTLPAPQSNILLVGNGFKSSFHVKRISSNGLQSLKLINQGITLPETNSLHLKIGHPNRKVVFQPSILRGYVSFREGITLGVQIQSTNQSKTIG